MPASFSSGPVGVFIREVQRREGAMVFSDPSIAGPRGVFGQVEQAERDVCSPNACLCSPPLGLLVPRNADETRSVVLLLRKVPHVLGMSRDPQIRPAAVQRIVIDVIDLAVIWGLEKKTVECEISVPDAEVVLRLRVALRDEPVSRRNEFGVFLIDQRELALREGNPASTRDRRRFGRDLRSQLQLFELRSPRCDCFLRRREIGLPQCLPVSDDPRDPVFSVSIDARVPCAAVDPYLGHTWDYSFNHRRDTIFTSGSIGEC